MTPLSMLNRRSTLARAAAVALTFAVLAPTGVTSADARAGGGFSFGSRGSRTFSAPPSTMTAPRPAAPFQRTDTPSFGQQSAGMGGGLLGQPRRFGFGSGLAAGLLGAGLFGMLGGGGFFGGLGSLSSVFGLLLQIGLIILAVRFALNWMRGRNGGPAYANGPTASSRSGLGGSGAGLGGGAGQGSSLALAQTDFAAFERMLSDIQLAYSREDMNALARLATPEMARNLGEELASNQRQGVRNELTDIHLIRGDLSEAWREAGADYATVAMRFAARDTMLDRTTGRVVSGDASRAVEAVELWTFRRSAGDGWRLAAIQQSN